MSEKTQKKADQVSAGHKGAGLTLAARMCGVMGEITRIPKSGFNKFDNYYFATESDVADLIRPKMAEWGIAEVQTVLSSRFETLELADGKGRVTPTTFAICRYKHTFMSAEDNSDRIEIEAEGSANVKAAKDKWPYVCSTGASKYAYLRTFKISSGDTDPEFDSNSDRDSESSASSAGRGAAPVRAGAVSAGEPPLTAEAKMALEQIEKRLIKLSGAVSAAAGNNDKDAAGREIKAATQELRVMRGRIRSTAPHLFDTITNQINSGISAAVGIAETIIEGEASDDEQLSLVPSEEN